MSTILDAATELGAAIRAGTTNVQVYDRPTGAPALPAVVVWLPRELEYASRLDGARLATFDVRAYASMSDIESGAETVAELIDVGGIPSAIMAGDYTAIAEVRIAGAGFATPEAVSESEALVGFVTVETLISPTT